MNISVHIERLVIDAALLPSGATVAVQHAVQAELGRLLGAPGDLPHDQPQQQHGALPPADATTLGRHAAHAAFDAMTGMTGDGRGGGRHG